MIGKGGLAIDFGLVSNFVTYFDNGDFDQSFRCLLLVFVTLIYFYVSILLFDICV